MKCTLSYVQLQPTLLGFEADNPVKDSDVAIGMESDNECGTLGVKESQFGRMDALMEAMELGSTPVVPVLDDIVSANVVGAFHDNALKQTSSVLHRDVCHL